MFLENFIKICGFIQITIGAVGILLNEFVWDTSSNSAIIFAVVGFIGLANLAFVHFGMRKRDK